MSFLLCVVPPWISVKYKLKSTGYWRLLNMLGVYGLSLRVESWKCSSLGFIDENPLLQKQDILRTNSARIGQAEIYLRDEMLGKKQEVKFRPEDTELVVCIITTRRLFEGLSPSYLLQASTAFHRELQHSADWRITLTICDVDTQHNPEVDLFQKWRLIREDLI